MTPDEFNLLASYGEPIGRLGGAFFVSDQAKAFAKKHRLRGWQGYFLGRCACLGQAPASVVHSVCGFFPTDFVTAHWDGGWATVEEAGTPASGVAQDFADACADWGEHHLADFDGSARLAALAERVIDHADSSAAPLFAGWRDQQRPEHPAGRAYLAVNTLRELRGAQHLSAVLASGLAPVEAIVTGQHGAAGAAFFGWPAGQTPKPTDEMRTKRQAAEDLTDQMAVVPFTVLSDPERAELGELLTGALRHATTPGDPRA